MRRHTRAVYIVFVFFVLSLTYGCASYRAWDLPRISNWPPAPPSSEYSVKLIRFVIGAELTINGKAEKSGGLLLNMVSLKTEEAYLVSGLFRVADPGYEYQPDYIIEVRVSDRETVDPLSMLFSALTLFIKEGEMTDEYTLHTTIKDRNGVVLGSFEKSETVVYKQRLGLFFAMFTRLPDVVSKQALYDLNCATINEALAKGVFQ